MKIELNQFESAILIDTARSLKSCGILTNDSSDEGTIKYLENLLNNSLPVDEHSFSLLINIDRENVILACILRAFFALEAKALGYGANNVMSSDGVEALSSLLAKISECTGMILIAESRSANMSSSVILRTILEMSWLSCILLYYPEKLCIYNDKSISDTEKWRNHFRPILLRSAMKNLEESIFPRSAKGYTDYHQKIREEMYSIYSNIVHSGYCAVNNMNKNNLRDTAFCLWIFMIYYEYILVRIRDVKFDLNEITLVSSILYSFAKNLVPHYLGDYVWDW